jgi:hypothetical protein
LGICCGQVLCITANLPHPTAASGTLRSARLAAKSVSKAARTGPRGAAGSSARQQQQEQQQQQQHLGRVAARQERVLSWRHNGLQHRWEFLVQYENSSMAAAVWEHLLEPHLRLAVERAAAEQAGAFELPEGWLLNEPDGPETSMLAAAMRQQDRAAAASSAGGSAEEGGGPRRTTCGLRVGTKFTRKTAGALFMMCGCGYLFPGMELPDSESTRMVMLYILRMFEHLPPPLHGEASRIVLFDDMCHLLRWATRQRSKHPGIERFVSEFQHFVDRFHFEKNHVGAWCTQHVNPRDMPDMPGPDGTAVPVNSSVMEQRNRHISGFKYACRNLNKARFAFRLLEIVSLDHVWREMGLLL